MSAVTVSIDLGGLINTGQAITREILPRVREAVGAIAAQGQKDWADSVMKAPGIWSEEKKRYVQSIRWEYTGEFAARIWADYRFAEEIENGRPPRDLKKMLDTSLKVRTVQKGKNAGKRYLIIPFQHNTPGSTALAPSMPQSVYDVASQLAPSRIVGQGMRESGTGAWNVKSRSPAMVRQHKYEWGGRLNTADMPGLSAKEARRLDGMYRFDSQGQGGVRRSTYLSFRVMLEGSPGWIVPAQAGRQFVPQVVGRLQPLAEQVIAKAVQLDLAGPR